MFAAIFMHYVNFNKLCMCILNYFLHRYTVSIPQIVIYLQLDFENNVPCEV